MPPNWNEVYSWIKSQPAGVRMSDLVRFAGLRKGCEEHVLITLESRGLLLYEWHEGRHLLVAGVRIHQYPRPRQSV
jgi:hypothetical protein